MAKLILAVFAVFGVSTLAGAAWDEKAQANLSFDIAQGNAKHAVEEFYSQKTGQELDSNQYTADVKMISASSQDGIATLPASYSVSLVSGADSSTLISAEVSCVRGVSIQESRFTRITRIDCKVTRVLSE